MATTGGRVAACATALVVLCGLVAVGMVGASAWYGVPVAQLLDRGPQRVLAAVEVRPGGGSYAFIRTQPGDPTRPVTWNPCRPVEVVHNPSGAPAASKRLLRRSLRVVSRATGLSLRLVGTTGRRPGPPGGPGGTPTGGRDRQPVLVAWSSPAETPGLAGPVAGLGGSTARSSALGGPSTYVTGTVVLDAPALQAVLRRPGGRAQVRAVLLHELGHVVGLDHVAAPGELMNAHNTGLLAFGPGDREGLARLGRGPCRG